MQKKQHSEARKTEQDQPRDRHLIDFLFQAAGHHLEGLDMAEETSLPECGTAYQLNALGQCTKEAFEFLNSVKKIREVVETYRDAN